MEKYLSVQMYMKARCNENMITPYLLQYYDVKMEDGNTMKGNVVRSAKWGGDWQVLILEQLTILFPKKL